MNIENKTALKLAGGIAFIGICLIFFFPALGITFIIASIITLLCVFFAVHLDNLDNIDKIPVCQAHNNKTGNPNNPTITINELKVGGFLQRIECSADTSNPLQAISAFDVPGYILIVSVDLENKEVEVFDYSRDTKNKARVDYLKEPHRTHWCNEEEIKNLKYCSGFPEETLKITYERK